MKVCVFFHRASYDKEVGFAERRKFVWYDGETIVVAAFSKDYG
jgi:hypothetical protein